jgi:hypothetical protein
MTRIAIISVVFLSLSGCTPDTDPRITGHDLRLAYDICIGYRSADNTLQNRIACTRAVYGGEP